MADDSPDDNNNDNNDNDAGEPEGGDKGDKGDKKASKEVVEELNSGFDEVAAMAGEVGKRVGQVAGASYDEAKEQWKRLEPQVKEKLKTAKETLNDVTDSAAKELTGLFGELKTSLKSLRKKL
jgi:ElaB/YqjD/DUF883 family membrane-anchored ribosome-binding protein